MNTTIKRANRSGVYLLKHLGVVVYVGQSKDVLFRMNAHGKKIFDEVEIIWCPRKRAKNMEKQLISKLRPKLNGNQSLGGGNQIRLTKDNETSLMALVKDSKNDLLTVSRAANMAIEKGRVAVRNLFVKPATKNGGSK